MDQVLDYQLGRLTRRSFNRREFGALSKECQNLKEPPQEIGIKKQMKRK